MVGKTIKELRKRQGLSQVEFAERLNVSRSSVSMWETDAREIDNDTLSRIADFFGVTTDFLLGRQTFSYKRLWDLLKSRDSVIPLQRKRVRVLGNIAAGEPIFADEEYDEYVETDDDRRVDFALRVVGDSMEPRLYEGDVVFFRAQEDVEDGQIAAVLVGDEAMLKHVYHTTGGVQIVSDNLKYPPRMLTGDVRIIGLALYYKRDL